MRKALAILPMFWLLVSPCIAQGEIVGSPFAGRLVTEFHVPLPPLPVTVHRAVCPEPFTAGVCADQSTSEIWAPIGTMPRYTLAHELGHVFDAQVLTRGDHQRFRRLFHQLPGLRLEPGYWWRHKEHQLTPPAEVFADAYSACAVGLKHFATGYGYNPLSWRTHRRFCRAIRRQDSASSAWPDTAASRTASR